MTGTKNTQEARQRERIAEHHRQLRADIEAHGGPKAEQNLVDALGREGAFNALADAHERYCRDKR